MHAAPLRSAVLAGLISAALALPLLAYAQSADLPSTIRAAIYADPRTASLSQTQVDAMVTALAGQAQKQGMTANDITWRPQVNAPASMAATCTFPTAFCVLNSSFGFDGSDNWIPLGLLLSSLLLMFIIAALIRHHRMHAPLAA